MNENISSLAGGESLDHFHSRYEFKLIGLNKPWKTGGFTGYYATVQYGKEDWFHSGFDEKVIPIDRQKALFDMFKNSEDSLWKDRNHKVRISCDGFSSSGAPIKPIIRELILDEL